TPESRLAIRLPSARTNTSSPVNSISKWDFIVHIVVFAGRTSTTEWKCVLLLRLNPDACRLLAVVVSYPSSQRDRLAGPGLGTVAMDVGNRPGVCLVQDQQLLCAVELHDPFEGAACPLTDVSLLNTGNGKRHRFAAEITGPDVG